MAGLSACDSLAPQAQNAVQPPGPLLHAALGHARDQPEQAGADEEEDTPLRKGPATIQPSRQQGNTATEW